MIVPYTLGWADSWNRFRSTALLELASDTKAPGRSPNGEDSTPSAARNSQCAIRKAEQVTSGSKSLAAPILLASFPRSGSSLARLLIEQSTGMTGSIQLLVA